MPVFCLDRQKKEGKRRGEGSREGRVCGLLLSFLSLLLVHISLPPARSHFFLIVAFKVIDPHQS